MARTVQCRAGAPGGCCRFKGNRVSHSHGERDYATQAIVSDYAAVNRMKAERSLAFDQEVSRAEAELADVKAGAMACLAHLEQHYYASKHKPPVSMSKHKDADMQPLFNLALDLGDA